MWQRIKSLFSRRQRQVMPPKALGAYRTPAEKIEDAPHLLDNPTVESMSKRTERVIQIGSMMCRVMQCDHCKSLILNPQTIHWCSDSGWMYL